MSQRQRALRAILCPVLWISWRPIPRALYGAWCWLQPDAPECIINKVPGSVYLKQNSGEFQAESVPGGKPCSASSCCFICHHAGLASKQRCWAWMLTVLSPLGLSWNRTKAHLKDALCKFFCSWDLGLCLNFLCKNLWFKLFLNPWSKSKNLPRGSVIR